METKFCEIFLLLLTESSVVKSKGNISQNFVAFSEYMNFTVDDVIKATLIHWSIFSPLSQSKLEIVGEAKYIFLLILWNS